VFKGGTEASYKANIDAIRHAAATARGEMVWRRSVRRFRVAKLPYWGSKPLRKSDASHFGIRHGRARPGHPRPRCGLVSKT